MGTGKLNLLWSTEAQLDVLGIGDYCEAQFGLLVALRVMDEYQALAEVLCGQPRIGRWKRNKYYKGMQLFAHPYEWSQVYYCFSETDLLIVRVFDTRIYPQNQLP